MPFLFRLCVLLAGVSLIIRKQTGCSQNLARCPSFRICTCTGSRGLPHLRKRKSDTLQAEKCLAWLNVSASPLSVANKTYPGFCAKSSSNNVRFFRKITKMVSQVFNATLFFFRVFMLSLHSAHRRIAHPKVLRYRSHCMLI